MVFAGIFHGVKITCCLISLAAFLVDSSAVVSINLLQYVNDGRLADGRKCEWHSACDPFFVICLRNIDSSTCDIGHTITSHFSNTNIVKNFFSFSIIKYPISKWKGRMVLRVDSWDHDSVGGNEFIDRMSGTYYENSPSSSEATAKAHSQRLYAENRRQYTWFDITFRVWCEGHYYGADCTTYCIPKNNGEGHYTCSTIGHKVCIPGWLNPSNNCLDRDECYNNPCQNEGHCAIKNNGYVCTCTPDYKGRNCEIKIKACESGPCLNGGLCIDGASSNLYNCSCLSEYEGPNCESKRKACQRQPCKNGGICYDGNEPTVYKCQCPAGYKGINCETLRTACETNFCHNGGICKDDNHTSRFTCLCPETFRGQFCELVNACHLSPCLNNGRCVPLNVSGEFRCKCPPSYFGDTCEKVDSCFSTPCANNGTCHQGANHDGNYTCECEEGFEGSNCDEVITLTTPTASTVEEIKTTQTRFSTLEELITSQTTLAPTHEISNHVSTSTPAKLTTLFTSSSSAATTDPNGGTPEGTDPKATTTDSKTTTTTSGDRSVTSSLRPVRELLLKNRLNEDERRSLHKIISKILMQNLNRSTYIPVQIEFKEIQKENGSIVTLVKATAVVDGETLDVTQVNRLLFQKGVDWLSSRLPQPIYTGALKQTQKLFHQTPVTLSLTLGVVSAVIVIIIILIVLLFILVRRRTYRRTHSSMCEPFAPEFNMEDPLPSPYEHCAPDSRRSSTIYEELDDPRSPDGTQLPDTTESDYEDIADVDTVTLAEDMAYATLEDDFSENGRGSPSGWHAFQ